MKFLLVLIALTLLPTAGYASCEDGHRIAKQEVTGLLFRKIDPRLRRLMNCKVTANEEFQTLRNGDEVYTVTTVCGQEGFRKTSLYKVVLHEVEDAVCVTKSVTRIGEQG
jgi:hypothetical protein